MSPILARVHLDRLDKFHSNFREHPFRTRVNKGKRKGQGCYAPALVRVYVALNVRRDTTVRRDDGGLVNARQNAIIGVGRQGS